METDQRPDFDGFEEAQPTPPNLRTNVALLRLMVTNLEREVHSLKDNMITKDQFQPIKLIVYGIVASALTAVLAGLLALIINSSPMHKADITIPETRTVIALVRK